MFRIASNYGRIALGFACGLATIRLQLSYGADAFAAIMIALVSIGVVASIRETLTAAFVAPLANALHRPSPGLHHATQRVCLRIAAFAGVGSAGLILAYAAAGPLIGVPDGLAGATTILLSFKAAEAAFAIAMAPRLAECLVHEKPGRYNSWLFCERFGDLAAAAAPWVLGLDSAHHALMAYGATSSLLAVVVAWVHARPPESPPLAYAPLDEQPVRAAVWSSIRANGAIILAANLYARVSLLQMSLWFGAPGATSFGIANQLANYARQAAAGASTGVDAIAAKLQTAGRESARDHFVARSTRLQAAIVLPTVATLAWHTESALSAWLGEGLSELRWGPDRVAAVARWLMIGAAVRTIADAWLKVLAGISAAGRCSRFLIVSGVLNPVLGAVALAAASAGWGWLAPAIVLATIQVICFGVLAPTVTAAVLGVSRASLARPIVAPAVWTAAAFACGVAVERVGAGTAGQVVAFLAAYLLLAALAVLRWLRVRNAIDRSTTDAMSGVSHPVVGRTAA
ncbi:MAG: hypothetical protein AAF805_01805 [Planctomycetota bacterium]